MVSSVFKQAAEMLRRRKRNRRWLTVFLCLAVIAVMGTLVVLKPTGRAMTREEKVLACKYVLHQHTESCYGEGENGKELICGYADFVIHQHAAPCYDAAGNQVCTLPEVEAHVHEAGCFEEERSLICGQLEGDGGHEHAETCYGEAEQVLVCGQEEGEEHTHSEECYQTGEAPLVCGMEAGAGGHEHTEACIQVNQKLICTKPEARPHIHDNTCYTKDANGNEVRTCGLLQVEEHIHREDCFETIEVEVEDTELSGEPVSESESADAAGSETETESISGTETAETSEAESSEAGTEDPVYICGLEEHIHGEECRDENGELTCGLEEHAHDENCVEPEEEKEYICGLTEHVHSTECYDGNGELICGLTEHTHDEGCLAETEAAVLTQTWRNEKYAITASYTAAAELPENALLQVEEITEESDPERYSQRDSEAQELLEESMRMKCLFNIGFFADGAEVEPQDKVTVTVQFLDENGYAEGAPITIVHFAKEKTEVLEGSQIDNNGVTSFDTESFSDMAVYTPDDGLVKDFSDLKRRLENAADGEEIVLGADFEVTEENLGDPNNSDAGGITVNAKVRVTLDLNGHTITVTGNKTLINVMNETELTIKDSAWKPEQDSRDAGAAWGEYGWKGPGSYDSATGTLTYYEIDSQKAGTGTNETLYTHTVTAGGKIVWNGDGTGTESLIFVSCGKLTLESGMLNGGGGRRAILLASTTTSMNELNLAGGYICNSVSRLTNTNWTDSRYQASGGAICAGAGTTINLTGTVIANNRVEYEGTTENWGSGGGIAMLGGGTLNISGGMITGNQSSVYGKGGGIYTSDGVTINLSDGNICNNKDQMQNANEIGGEADWGQPRHKEYAQFDGGGGMLVGLGGTLNMTGGKVCGNTGSGGGGIQTVWSSNSQTGPKLHINGGYIARNLAMYHEGGGLVIVGNNGIAEIAAAKGSIVYITNNKTETRHDWGGGGAFCVENAQMVIQGALVSGNTAKGYGGGVGGCSNAQIIDSVSPLTLDMGTAVYDNRAEGDSSATATAGGQKWYKNGLTEDSEFAVDDEVFQRWITKSGSQEQTKAYNDYYCEQYSTVSNLMLGGGYSNWVGSSNDIQDVTGQAPGSNNSMEIQFKREQNDIRSAKNRMGLTADPTQGSKDKANAGASVFITGNYSSTHGGGVQCNGVLLLGDCKNYTFGDSLQFKATKQLFSAAGEKITDLTDRVFEFGIYLYDKETGTKGECIGTAKNDAAGMIVFAPLTVSGDGEQDSIEKTYLIQEVADSVQGGIQWESTEYLVSFTLTKETSIAAGNVSYQWNQYYIDPDTVMIQSRSGNTEDWTPAEKLVSAEGSGANDVKIYQLPDNVGDTSGATFTNREIEKIDVRVKKEWSGTQAEAAKEEQGTTVQVQLFRSTDGAAEEAYGDSVELTAQNEWTYTWSGLIARSSDSNGSHSYSYTVKEIGLTFGEGSSFTYDQFYSVVEAPAAEENVQTTVITNTHMGDLKYNLKLNKVRGDETGEAVLPYSPLAGAKFELYRVEGETRTLLEFTQGADGYEYVGEAAEGQEPVEQSALQKLITDIDGVILVKNLPGGTYQFREVQAPAGFVAQPDDKMPVVTLGVTEPEQYVKEVVYSETPIVDPLYYYEIPEAGGMGTDRYMTLGGMLFLLAVGIGVFCLGKKRSRKENN